MSPLGSLKFWNFFSFLFILKLFYSEHFHNTLNYASTANIEEAMRFYNLGNKTFETDFFPGLTENLKIFETEGDDTDDEDTELVEQKGIKQVNANECDYIGIPDGPEQYNNTDNQGDNTFTIEDTDDYDDDCYIDLETNGSDVHYKIDTANVLPLIAYRCLLKKPKLHKSNAKLTT